MDNFSYEDYKFIIKNTKLIFDNNTPPLINEFFTINYSVIGEVPYSANQSIEKNGTVTISPRLIFSLPEEKDLYEILQKIKEIETRVLLFNNMKFEFSDEPRIRYKLNIKESIEKVKEKYYDKDVLLLVTPKSNFWQISLLYYLSTKLFNKNENGNKRF
jgi:hypothetical protein